MVTSINKFFRNVARPGSLFFVLSVVVIPASSTQNIIQEKISVSRELGGIVVVKGTDISLGGATVELCTSDWKNVLASTKTDKEGRFSFQPPKGKLSYVRVSMANMDTFELRVRISRHAKQVLKIELPVAT